jgi:hypothetical protein
MSLHGYGLWPKQLLAGNPLALSLCYDDRSAKAGRSLNRIEK